MKKIALKAYGKIVTVILSIFGITFAGISCIHDTPAPEYGVPSADYIVKGKVTDATTNQPIKGIGIIVPDRAHPEYGDTVYTNDQGDYKVELLKTFPYWNEKMKVIAKDLDGMENGEFRSDSIEISFSHKDLIKKGSGNWYEGTFEKAGQDFKLKKEETVVGEK